MAKRKRLTPAQGSYLAPDPKPAGLGPAAGVATGGIASAPIAQVASEASAHAALEEVTGVLNTARTKGLMIEELPLSVIDSQYLVRDRLDQNPDEMAALEASLRARGQQTPIEVVALPEPRDGMTYGLISGWRRLSALKTLYAKGSEPKFASVQARIIQPESAEEAYVAMVEENEIRVNLSHYERARIAVRAMKQGIYANQKLALQGLFANTTRSRRSKIGSFVALVEQFDSWLHFPTAISERLGLALVREMDRQPLFAQTLTEALRQSPRLTAEDELDILNTALTASEGRTYKAPPVEETTAPAPAPSRPRVRSTTPQMAAGERLILNAGPGLKLGFSPDQRKIELMGNAITEEFLADLQDWLRNR
ncbi:ParB/RepB/Spo0J family partition protein [Epibacterium ulvae]|uniref:ParB/RepB/Spo0J family partition protein n=1 Tax=Epibacterium ulvae TaxID=1156985 RepID=UPI002491C60D|nr:ParB N-terminal domain-containing protein [Epibacterium ulvae]